MKSAPRTDEAQFGIRTPVLQAEASSLTAPGKTVGCDKDMLRTVSELWYLQLHLAFVAAAVRPCCCRVPEVKTAQTLGATPLRRAAAGTVPGAVRSEAENRRSLVKSLFRGRPYGALTPLPRALSPLPPLHSSPFFRNVYLLDKFP